MHSSKRWSTWIESLPSRLLSTNSIGNCFAPSWTLKITTCTRSRECFIKVSNSCLDWGSSQWCCGQSRIIHCSETTISHSDNINRSSLPSICPHTPSDLRQRIPKITLTESNSARVYRLCGDTVTRRSVVAIRLFFPLRLSELEARSRWHLLPS